MATALDPATPLVAWDCLVMVLPNFQAECRDKIEAKQKTNSYGNFDASWRGQTTRTPHGPDIDMSPGIVYDAGSTSAGNITK